jgi:uncharacterized protein YfaS (alpha-2-macroglobulin family)
MLTLIALGTQSCKQGQTEITPSYQYASYLNAYTGGVISQTSTIRVELMQDRPAVEPNTELKDNPFKFSPSLKGKAYWITNRTIEFVPDEDALKPGQHYEATFMLGDFVEVEKDLRKFKFTFRVLERNFTIDMKSLFIHASDPESVTVKGELRFSDVVDKKLVEKMITAKAGNNQPLTAVIEDTDHPNVYRFVIDDIRKGDEDGKVDIEIDGKALGIDHVVTRQVVIPGKGSFRVIGSVQITDPENGIAVTFSEPLAASQNLRGLIEIEGVKTTTRIQNNIVTVFYEATHRNTLKLNIHAGVKSASGKKLETDATISFTLKAENPQVKLLTKGVILPDSKNLIIPFRAVSLHAVDVSVVRIYENNVLTFLQDNTLGSSSELRRFGRPVYTKTLRLDNDPAKDITRWEDYSIDLSNLIRQEPGAIYRIMFSFKQAYSAYPCRDDDGATGSQLTRLTDDEDDDTSAWDVPQPYYSMEEEGYDWEVFNWHEKDNPCHPSYYMYSYRKVSVNLLATNLGIIVKRNSNNKLWIAVNNILDTAPLADIDVTAYNYQLQPIGTGKTDSDGFAVIEAKGVPFAVVATDGKQKTYLKVNDGSEKSVSRFDVGGKETKKGLKGFIYGERGVWRPGDTLHISFIMEDHEQRIPDKHPVSVEVFNPQGQFYHKLISTQGVNGFYTFHIPTKDDDPTGLWNAYVKVGGASFHKSLRIETIKPNRLKINLKLPGETIKAGEGDVRATLSSAWLTGATASNLKAKVEMKLTKVNTQFKNYTQYIFNNPATAFTSGNTDVFDGVLNSEGDAGFTIRIPEAANAPGMMQANITTRVYEPGGDVSFNTMAVPFSPFDSYVGVNLNQPENRYIETDNDHVFDVVTLNTDGKPVNRSNLEYKVYRIGWSWWWEKDIESYDSYINNTSVTPVATGRLKTAGGKAQFTFRINYPDWGRYLVYVKDNDSGHATGGTVYVDWPAFRGRSDKTDPSGITMLSFSLDKESYETGETVTAILPASSDGRALVAIENGSSVLHREWVQVSGKEDTKYRFKVSPKMAPNVYLHISLLQPHAQTVNDLPIRMYGVMPVFVTNKQTVLEPQIRMPDVLRPEEEFAVTVSEKSGHPMTYTLAVVDDGLLDLTNFKTPDPWQTFYAREALGIRTWDMYDDVVGVYTGTFGALFGTGGDEMLKGADEKANRFRPIVKFLGPFTVKKGDSRTHRIRLPMYVGSVRTMVVAGQHGAYGKAEKTTPVRSPLMILSTLPRVLSIGEEILLPVNIFALEQTVGNVSVNVETSPNLRLTDGDRKSVTFAQTGDQIVYFKIKTGSATGAEKVKITASSGSHSTSETIEINVRNPNPVVTRSESKLLGAGETATLNYRVTGNSRDNWVKLEASRIPSVDISRRFDYLYSYDHYCTEQLTSKAMPLLFVSQFKDMEKQESETIRKNVQEAIRQLYARQLPNGGFVYWPGYESANEWITSYAGAFLVMAQEKGYDVNGNVLSKWKAFQRSMSQSWSAMSRDSKWHYWQSDLQQAYRLYALALAGAPELGAMNRLKEVKELSEPAKWRLAAAYALSGKTDAANELVFNIKTTVDPYSSDNHVYGSYDRDEAMILETLVLMGKHEEAFAQAKKVSRNLSEQFYFSTQSTAFSLTAMGRLAEKLSGSLDLEWSSNGGKQNYVKSVKALYQADLPTTPPKGSVSLKNNGTGALYVDLISRTQLINDTLPVIADNLRLEVTYEDAKGHAVQVDNLKQGADFTAVVTVANISGTSDYKDVALTHIIPSGWEIYNERMIAGEQSASDFDYQDIRDDRVLTYFSLDRKQSKTFKVRLQAIYAGTFVLPAIRCEPMYDVSVQARTKAGHVTVVN